jgi:hypothetical protein
LKSATLRWWQAIDRGAVHVGEIDHFLSELDWDQDLIWFWHNKTRPWSGNGSVKSKVSICQPIVAVGSSVGRDGTADALWGIAEPAKKVSVKVVGDDITVTAPAGVVRLHKQGDRLVGTFTVTWRPHGGALPGQYIQ